jgi:hypothetical protein
MLLLPRVIPLRLPSRSHPLFALLSRKGDLLDIDDWNGPSQSTIKRTQRLRRPGQACLHRGSPIWIRSRQLNRCVPKGYKAISNEIYRVLAAILPWAFIIPLHCSWHSIAVWNLVGLPAAGAGQFWVIGLCKAMLDEPFS